MSHAATESLTLADLEAQDPGARPASGAGERRFLCPLPACAEHRRGAAHRSLAVNVTTGLYHCHRCDARGILREFRTRGASTTATPRARRRPDRPALPPPPPPPPEPDGDALREKMRGWTPLAGTEGARYLEGRGLPVDLCDAAGVRFCAGFGAKPETGYAGRPAVVFAIRDEAARPVAIQARFIDGKPGQKFHTSGPARLGVFATPGALDAPAVAIVESPIDALSLAACAVPAVATCGKSNRPEWLLRSRAFRPVHVAYDADAPGDAAAAELIETLRVRYGALPRRARPEGAKDWNAALTAGILPAQLSRAFPDTAAPPPPDDEDDDPFTLRDAVAHLAKLPPDEMGDVSALEPYAALIDAALDGSLPALPATLPDFTVEDARHAVLCYAGGYGLLAGTLVAVTPAAAEAARAKYLLYLEALKGWAARDGRDGQAIAPRV